MNLGDFSIDLKATIAIAALIATIILALYFQWWRNRKKLSYDIISDTPLLATADEIKNDLQILYKGESVKNVRLVVIKIINDGYQPIKKDDFERPLGFSFYGDIQLLSVEIATISPRNLEVVSSVTENKITIEPLLLNSKDYFALKVLLSSNKHLIKPDARIVGVKSFKKRETHLFQFVMFKLVWPLIGGFAAFVIAFRFQTNNIAFRVIFYIIATAILTSSLLHLSATIRFVTDEKRYNQE